MAASYLRKLEHNVARYSLTPVAGLVALATEGASLTDDASARIARRHRRVRRKRESSYRRRRARKHARPLCSSPKLRTPRTLTRCSFARHASPDPATALLHFRTVADNATLPVLLHSQQGRALTLEAIAELAAHPNIIGLYDDELNR